MINFTIGIEVDLFAGIGGLILALVIVALWYGKIRISIKFGENKRRSELQLSSRLAEDIDHHAVGRQLWGRYVPKSVKRIARILSDFFQQDGSV